MPAFIVLDNPKRFPLDVPGAQTISARSYLTEARFSSVSRAKVFNLCRSYAYQSAGYYVSLLAEARGHRPLPSINTIQDLRQTSVVRIFSDDFDELMQKSLASIKSDRFTLSIYFGRNLAERHERLSRTLFEHFPVPLLRAEFVRGERWRLQRLEPIPAQAIPGSHEPFVIEQAERFFARGQAKTAKPPRFDLAILVDEGEVDAPSDEKALRKFVRAAQRAGARAELIGRGDFGRLAEYDALFIRETTRVNHHTFRFARRAEAEGLVVIDDPTSIIRCTNKVFQAELFEKLGVDCPKTMIIHRDNRGEVAERLGLPVVLKRPDSAFSTGVVKAKTEAELEAKLDAFLEESDLIIGQAYMPSAYDWRIGLLDGRALYACRYHMAPGHWQIQRPAGSTQRYGNVDTLPLSAAPAGAVETAHRAAAAVGKGLYGVDLKEIDGRFLVMEINDNPSIDAGCEDKILGDALYDEVIASFGRRLEERTRS